MAAAPAFDVAHRGKAVEGRTHLRLDAFAQTRDAARALRKRGSRAGHVALLLLDATRKGIQAVEPGFPSGALREIDRAPGGLVGGAQPTARELGARERLGSVH